jgi:branched-chain amino acid transport system permease protein
MACSGRRIDPVAQIEISPARSARGLFPSGGLAVFLVAVGLCLAPFVMRSDYHQSLLILFVINAILVISYRFTTIVGGWSFSHVAIMGLGAYTTGIVTQPSIGLTFWESLPLALLVSGLFSSIVAIPILRTKGFYFFLSTFAAGEALRQAFQQFPSVTGGLSGIAFIPRPTSIGPIDFTVSYNYYLLCLFISFLCFTILSAIERSRIGHTMRSVAENEDLSLSIGINSWFYRCFSFVAGSVIAAIAGSLLASYNGLVNPLDFSSTFMFKIITAAIIGGVVTRWGALVGLLYITIIEEMFRGYDILIPLFYGVSVIGVLVFMSGGLESIRLPKILGGK